MKEIIDFLKDLAANNNRDWFSTNKERYLMVRESIEALASLMIAAVAEVDPEAGHLTVADCTYRIYRDTRFSPDKTPYKTHIGIFVNPPYGKKGLTGGYYLHIEPGNCMFAAGNICHPAPVLKAIRKAIFDNIDEYISIVEDKAFKKIFPTVGENPLKTAPKGFPKDWEHINYIRPKDYIACKFLNEEDISDKNIIDTLRPVIKQAARYNNFLNFTIEDFCN